MTLTLKLNPQLEEQLRQEAARLGVGPDDYAVRAISERLGQSQPLPPHLTAEESDLLQRINHGFPAEVWRRFDDLIAKRKAETLTDAEHRELIQLSDEIETAHLGRLQLVAQLARLRNMPLLDFMRQMGIGPHIRGGADA
jgi:hypothetical protein